MAEKKEQETAVPADRPKDEPKPATVAVKPAKQQDRQKQDGLKTLEVLVLKKCEHGGRPLQVLKRYELPEKAALKLIAEGKAKTLA